jgi:HK97 family phage portal protein
VVWPFSKREAFGYTAAEVIGLDRNQRGRAVHRRVKREDALRHSAVWACLRLRADLVSTMPQDVYRRIGGIQVGVTKPPVLISPGGEQVDMLEWMYSTQFDLDSCGNTFGLITALDAMGLPAQIELVPYTAVTVLVKNGVVRYRIGSTEYEASKVWHEKQFTSSGLHVGLSPIAYAAMSINGYLSAQEFAAEWFGNSAIPAARLKNTQRVVPQDVSQKIKERFKSSMANGDLFVHGNDWEYEMISAKASESQFLEERRFGLGDVCRFLGVPGDMIDAETSSGSITYANVTQRNLQLLIMNLNPAIIRRENALSKLLPRPRFLKINRDAILQMDLKSRYDSYAVGIANRFIAPSETRELEDRPPFTPEQEAEFARLFPSKALTAPTTGVPA